MNYKNSNSSLGSDAIRLSVSRVVSLGLSMVIAMILSRVRTLEEYGTYSQLLLVVNLVASFLMLGLPNSISYFLAREESQEGKQKFLAVYYTLNTFFSLICGICLVALVIPIVQYFNNNDIYNYIYFLLIFPWAMLTSRSVDNILIVYNKTNLLVIFRICHSIVLLIIVLFIKVFSLDLMINMILFVIAESIFAIIVYVIVIKISGSINISFNKEWIQKIFKFSLPIGLAGAIGTINIELDKFMIGRLFDVELFAIYTNASRELPFSIIAASLTAVLLPQLARLLSKGKNQEAVNLWKNSIVLSFSVICFLSFGCIVFAREVIILLYSDKFIYGVGVFRMYCLLILLRSTYWGIILNSCGKTKFILYCSLASLFLNLVFNYLCYLLFGFIGPAIATLIVFVFLTFIQLIATSKVIKIKLSKIFPWHEILIILLFNTLFALIFYKIKTIIILDQYVGDIIESILLGVVWGIFYIVVSLKPLKKYWVRLNNNEVIPIE